MDDFEDINEIEPEMEAFVADIVATFHDTQDFKKGWQIIKDNYSESIGVIFSGVKPSDMHRVFNIYLQSIWNVMPLASNKYRTSPLPIPSRNDMCNCGSGFKYKQCCLHLSNDQLDLSSEDIWSILLDKLSAVERKTALEMRAIPITLILVHSLESFDNGYYQKAIDLLEPLFETAHKKSEDLAFAVNLLCNSYDGLNLLDEKLSFLEKIKNSKSKLLQSEAWQRLSVIYMDQGDPDAAWDAYHTARHYNHQDFGIDLLEINLLLGENKTNQAQERASFILRKMQKNGTYEDDGLINFFHAVAENPEEVMQEMFNEATGGELEELIKWVSEVRGRSTPRYKIEEVPPIEINNEKGEATMPTHAEYIFKLSAKQIKLEKQWQKVFSGIETFGTSSLPSDTDPWANATEWCEFLNENPSSFDNINIIDDLLLAVMEWEPSENIVHNLLIPLGERAFDIYSNLPETGTYNWLIRENRPLIRSLFNFSQVLEMNESHKGYIKLCEILLKANPNDNHGVRISLINHFLRESSLDDVESILQKYPNDMLIDIQMGSILFYLKMGDKSKAQKAWKKAQKNFKYIKSFLVNSSVKKPDEGDLSLGLALGSKQEAWLYREEMRDVWLSEKGSLGWLKKN